MKSANETTCGVCILAGGLSRRMGRDKARLRVGGRTMISHIAGTARRAQFRVRVIKRDLVERCGPLGGLYTGLKGSRGTAEIFMACDMPFVTSELLVQLTSLFARHGTAIFVTVDGRAGFPCLLPVSALGEIAEQIHWGQFSLQELATRLRGRRLRLASARASRELINVNTQGELEEARQIVTATCH